MKKALVGVRELNVLCLNPSCGHEITFNADDYGANTELSWFRPRMIGARCGQQASGRAAELLFDSGCPRGPMNLGIVDLKKQAVVSPRNQGRINMREMGDHDGYAV